MRSKYTFGTDDAGAARLETIAQYFNPQAEQFIQKHRNAQPVETALDLGCGPGFTTAMLARVTNASSTIGLEKSSDFVAYATKRFPQCTFVQHDITQLPFPQSGNVIYCRFLLSHLPNPVALINRWIDELTPGGLLFIDETERIDTEVDVFREYISVNNGMIAAQGAALFVGTHLGAGEYAGRVIYNACDALPPVPNHQVASWFLPNTQTVWQKNDYVQSTLTPDDRRRISERIAHIQSTGDPREQSVWHMRRIVLQRHLSE